MLDDAPAPAGDSLAVHADALGFSRRRLLGSALAAGTTAAAAGLLPGFGAEARAASPGPSPDIPPAPVPIFNDPDLTFQCLFAFGAAASGASEFGEVSTAVHRIKAQDERYSAYYSEFIALAQRTTRLARDAEGGQNWATARGAYLRAATYYAQALFFVLATSRPTRAHEREVYRAMRDRWQRAGRLMNPAMQNVALPWNGPNGPMPGWFLRPSARREARPTLIMNNGSDAQAIDLWSAGGHDALARGWNVLIFDGPGQGAMLFERNQTFIPQWERVITPIVSWLRKRPDVDPDRIAITGSSFGGGLVPRAMAFERRVAAFAADPGVVNPSSTWTEALPAFFLQQLRDGQRAQLNSEWADFIAGSTANERFNLAKRLEIYPGKDFFDQLKAIVQFDYRTVIPRIRRPGLVIDNEIEQFFPGQPGQMYRALRSRPKRLVKFTVTEGAQYHCEPMAPTLRNAVVLDWLGETVVR